VNTKKIVSLSLLVFVFVSSVFLVYKGLVQKGHNKANATAETQAQNTLLTQRSTSNEENKVAKEIVLEPQEKATPFQAARDTIKSRIVAYYFHGTYRCYTCLTIERYSREAIKKYFSKELQDGRLEFRPLNVEEPENRHYIQDYQLFTRSLVITLVKDNKQKEWKNLTEVWTYVRNREKFYQYVRDEVEKFLKET